MHQLLIRFFSAGLRMATLLAKFALVLALAKFLPPADFGLYGLLFATVMFFLMALGFDFYTYAHRELIVTGQGQCAALIRNQAVVYLFSYAVLLPIGLLIFFAGYLPWTLAIWFFPILALEHIAQEFNRLLVAMSQQGWASVVLFVRHGLWSLILVVWMYLSPVAQNLDWVLLAWTVGLLLACILGLSRLWQLDRASLQDTVDWAWIRRGLKIAAPFLVATLCLRALFTVDRYWIEAIAGLEVLAAYVLFFGMANAVFSVVDASVVSFLYPRLVRAVGQGDVAGYRKLTRSLTWQVVLTTAFFSLLALLLVHPLLQWLDRPIYSEHINFFYWLLAATGLFCISMIPHVGLYARRRDYSIVTAHILSLVIFGIVTGSLTPILGPTAIPAGLLVAFLFLWAFKVTIIISDGLPTGDPSKHKVLQC